MITKTKHLTSTASAQFHGVLLLLFLFLLLSPAPQITLRNGDVVARRGCGVVLHTKVDGRTGHVWLKCRSNQSRGALVDALVPWFENHSLTGSELNVQQASIFVWDILDFCYFGYVTGLFTSTVSYYTRHVIRHVTSCSLFNVA